MSDSTHRAEVVFVKLKPHTNADTLSIVEIYDGGYQAIVKTEQWQNISLGIYIQPDSLVPVNRPEFDFLSPCQINPVSSAVCDKGTRSCYVNHPERVRIRAKKLRGEWSMGLLIPAPSHANPGEDFAEALDITHYDPPEHISTGGEAESPPKKFRRPCPSCFGIGRVWPGDGQAFDCEACAGKGYPNDSEIVNIHYPNYDIESFRKYGRHAFVSDEPVWITEKIHGSNGRWVNDGERFYCGSRTEWKRQQEDNLWWQALNKTPALTTFLYENPGIAVYGEVCGKQKSFNYGNSPKEFSILVFDLFRNGNWIDAVEAFQIGIKYGLPWVPVLHSDFPYDFEKLMGLAEGNSLVPGANHMREGIVVKPLKERWNQKIQDRVCLKIVSKSYWEKS